MRSFIDQIWMTGEGGRQGFVRRILQWKTVNLSLSVVTAFICVWMVGFLPQSTLFWTILDTRFAADELYQTHRLFLPDRKRQIPVVIVGDTMFQSSLAASETMQPDAGSIVIDGYDADDLDVLFDGLKDGMRYTDTTVCSLVVQVSPLFMIRSKALHEEQIIDLIGDVKIPKSPRRRFRNLFDILRAWAETENTMPTMTADARRPATLVGQAQFADESRENWNLAFAKADGFEGQIIAVLDTRGTQWPAVSDLVADTRRSLDDLAARNEMISWTTVEDFDAARLPGCSS